MGRIFGGIIFIIIIIGIVLWSFSRPLPPLRDPSPTPTPSTAPSPTPAEKSSTNITVRSPLDNTVVGKTFEIEGSARVFENVVSYRVRSQLSQQILASGFTTADAPDIGQFGDFSAIIALPENTSLAQGDKLQLEIYQESAKDGSDADKVTILLNLQEE